MSVTVGIRELRENLRRYVDLVRTGSNVVIITDRGRPVARLEGPSNIERMIAEGRIRPAKKPKRPMRRDLRARLDGPPSLSDMVIDDRRRDRA